MTIDTLIMLAGAFVAVLPYLGFPNSWDRVLFLIAGVLVIALGIVVRRRGERLVVRKPRRASHVIENIPDRPREMQASPFTPAPNVEHDNA